MRDRDNAIDVARGLAIILVIIGHLNTNFTQFIYSFHMPLFFVVSGMTFSNYCENMKISHFIGKRIRKLIVPYYLWEMIYVPFEIGNIGNLVYGSRKSIMAISGYGPLWFLPCLFISNFLFFCILHAVCYIKPGGGRCALLFGIVTILVLMGCFLAKTAEYYSLPCNLDTALVSMVYVYIGWLLSNIKKRHSTMRSSMSAALFIVIMIILVVTYNENLPRSEYGTEYVACAFSVYGNFLWFYFNGIIGSLGVIILSSIMVNNLILKEGFTHIGRHTLTILATHVEIIDFTKTVFEKYSLEVWLPAKVFIILAICVIFSSLLDVIIKRYVPCLNGTNGIFLS